MAHNKSGLLYILVVPESNARVTHDCCATVVRQSYDSDTTVIFLYNFASQDVIQ